MIVKGILCLETSIICSPGLSLCKGLTCSVLETYYNLIDLCQNLARYLRKKIKIKSCYFLENTNESAALNFEIALNM